MAYNKASIAAIDFARRVKSRILGNDDDQRICRDQPSRVYDFGILFARSDAEANRRGDRSIFKPNAITVRFEVSVASLPNLELEICPSFWLYFRRAPGEVPPADWGDYFDPDDIWIDWRERAGEFGYRYSPQEWLRKARKDQSDSGEEMRPFVRKRYARSYGGSVAELAKVELDLDLFRDNWIWLGDGWKYPWSGHIEVRHRDGSSPDLRLVEVRLVNDYRYYRRGGLRGEPAWFDVRLRVKANTRVLCVYCPLLDKDYEGVPVQTVNCVLDRQYSSFDDSQSVIVVEQIGEVIRHRRMMRSASTFADAAADPFLLLHDARQAADTAEANNPTHAAALRQACNRIEKDAAALKALQVVTETFNRSFPIEPGKPASAWYLHQAAIVVLAVSSYMEGGKALLPLVINVPTAGGKTEAFTAAAFWTVAYEAFRTGRMGTAIIKYPTTMLSDDQASRLARYVIHFDAVMPAYLDDYKPRGLGLFFGKDEKDADPQQCVGEKCPVCSQPWQAVDRLDGASGRRLACPNGHSLYVSIHDEVFYMRPAIIVSTLHKFVAKAQKGLMRTLLGGQGYWCQHERQVTDKPHCWARKKGGFEKMPHRPAHERTLITALVLDEAHLIREDTGALASHFETHYLELAQSLGGRYPLILVSTATIAHAEHHTQQLGLGRGPTVFPGKEGQNEDVYYELSDQVHHVILACMPRGRAIAWAVPHLVGDYVRVAEMDTTRFEPFIPTMVYCPSYLTRDQVRDGIRRQVNEPRFNKGLDELKMDEFSRQRFNQEGQDMVLRRLRSEKIDAVLSTNIASVGVDLPNLNSIIYFGVPVNISEFVQSLNRVARRENQPGVAFLVLDPYKERDNSYYAYLEPFASFPHRIVEAIPLNRYARKAIDKTFDTIAMTQIFHWWRWQIKGLDIRRPTDFKAARGKQLSDTQVVPHLAKVFRAGGDPSEVYPARVRSLWSALANTLGRFGGKWIWEAPNLTRCWSLIPKQPEGTLAFSSEAQALKQANIQVIYGFDQSQTADIQDEEFGLVDGASEDVGLMGE